MGESQYLIDTNAIIDYLGGKLPNEGMEFMNGVVNAIPNISIIAKIELLSYDAEPGNYQLLKDFVEVSVIMDLNDEIVNSVIDIRKKTKIKIPDAIIAATALNYDLTLITRNLKDFDKIEDLQLVDPHKV